MAQEQIQLVERFPDAGDYCRLRSAAGMSPKTLEAARKGLPNTLYGVSLQREGEVIGMGRIIGDGGCFYTVVDVAVAPPYQGQGLGKRIMKALDEWLRRTEARYRIEVKMKPEGVQGFKPVRIRWVVERTHAWLGRCRRLSRDYDYNISSSETWVRIAAIQQMLRCLKPNTHQPQAPFKYPKKSKKVA